MPNLKLKLACWDYDRTRPLMDGRVKPEGIDLDIEILRPRHAFQRMLDDKEFQVSELSLASYTALKGRGNCPFVAVPVALSKIFRHSCIYVRADAGIRRPEDLKGKRVGTSQWGSTGLVFMRGMLQHDYGVEARDMHWFMGGLNSFVEPPLIPLDLPGDIRLDFLSGRQTLEQMFAAGELDALLSLYIPKLFLAGSPQIVRLFPSYKEVERDYYRRTRIFPIMHTVVLREDVYRAHPWAARSIYKAFCDARDLAVEGLYDTDALRVALPWLIDHVEEARRVFGEDFWAYGLEPNRPTFEAIGRYVHEQGLSPRVVSADELFLKDVEILRMIDPNNRPGGPNLIVTAKTAHKVHFLDAATLAMTATIDMPGSTHEIALSLDGRTAYASVYGDGVFAKRVNPDRRIVVIDLPSQSLTRIIDLGDVYAPHGVMIDASGTVWSSGELGNAVLAIDPSADTVQKIDVGATAHWVAVSHALGKLFVSVKQDHVVVVDIARRTPIDRIKVPHVVEGLAISPDGATLYVCAQTAAEFYVIDAASHALRRTVAIDGADASKRQMRRVRVSPDNKYVLVSSNQDHHAAIYAADGLAQIASFPTKRSPMGFGFAADGKHAYLCCHDDAVVLELELASGRVTRSVPTAAGCEFIVAYS